MADGRRNTGCVIFAAVVVIAAVAAFLAWTWYATTPQYASLRMLEAVSARDWPAFERWVDVESVVTTAVKAEVDKRIGGGIAAPLSSSVVSATVPAARAALRARIESGVPGVPRDVPLPVLVLGGVVRETSVAGDDAYVTVVAQRDGADIPIELKLRRGRSGWRVVEVRNASGVLGRFL